jgi:NTP pyrophosphatase (non-canonical NTP hydrolase)
MSKPETSRVDRMKAQRDEFNAMAKLASAYKALPAVVDDDYPEMRHAYEGAIRNFIDALKVNRPDEMVMIHEALTFRDVTAVNLARCNRWHPGGIEDWTPERWAVAMAGEAGEVCNALKKLFRIEDEIANISDPDRQLSTRSEAVAKIGEEIADTFLYLNLLACRLAIDLPTEIRAKFNSTSEKYGFPERIA